MGHRQAIFLSNEKYCLKSVLEYATFCIRVSLFIDYDKLMDYKTAKRLIKFSLHIIPTSIYFPVFYSNLQ